MTIFRIDFPTVEAMGHPFGYQDDIRTSAKAEVPTEAAPSQPSVTLSGARELLMTGQHEAALEAYEALEKEEGTRVEAVLGKARCRIATGDYEEAIRSLDDLNASKSAEWQLLRAELDVMVGKYDEALRRANLAAALDGNLAAARLLSGRMLELSGRRDDAIEAYRWFDRQIVERRELPKDAAWVTAAGVGFLRYSMLTRTNVADRTKHVLNDMLQAAYTKLDRSYWPARIAAANLLREKYNNDESDGSVSDYEAALRIHPNLPEAEIGLGEVALERWDFEEVERRTEQALSVNARFAPALHLLGKKLLVERRYEQAEEVAERALTLNTNDVVALAIAAASRACRYDELGAERLRSRVNSVSPSSPLFHRMLGDSLSGIRQYEASEREYKRAIDFDPTDANARTELGMMYMQWGREADARDALDAAWALDPFNERTKFTLELLESLEKFARVETENFVIKYDASKDPGLGEFLGSYLEEIHGAVTEDYEWKPKEKTIIEVFPTHRAFGVRITGKPWIHTVGACTGRVIALASPRKSTDLMGPYNLARVLKHEFTHTVTLSATENRIPHWFTEGLAVYQEDAPRSFEWSRILAEAARRDRLFTLESINWGFIRPKRAEDRPMAYAQSEWMCEYIVERFGYDSINAMLERFRRGQTQTEAFREQLGIESEAFDREFASWARKQIATWGFDLTPPEDAGLLREKSMLSPEDASLAARLARAEFDAEEFDRAIASARRALELDPNQATALDVLIRVLGEFLRREGNDSDRRAYEEQALPIVERLMEIDPQGWTGPKAMAEIMLRRKNWDRALEALQRLQKVCPRDPASWRGLAGIYLDRGQDELALPQLLELARTEEHDADVSAQVAGIHRRRGRLPDALYWYRQALFIDPFRAELHQELGDTAMQMGDTRVALGAYRMLTILDGRNSKYFEQAAFAAHKLGETEEARKLAGRAVELDANSPARTLIGS